MESIMENITIFYLILYFILGLVGLCFAGSSCQSKFVGACCISVAMTTLTFYVWWASLIVILLIGTAIAGKIENPGTQKTVMVVFAIFALLTAATGISYKNKMKAKDNPAPNQQEQRYHEQERQKQQISEEPYREQKTQEQQPVTQQDKSNQEIERQKNDKQADAPSQDDSPAPQDDSPAPQDDAPAPQDDAPFGSQASN